ncbi:MAG TPA: NADH-quinone oxidoreductase subunit NuoN [Campylobacterales bacterium]|nr:NADH-quinone oxidoreductase subunit NuoN [Campylobacterales bacterium]
MTPIAINFADLNLPTLYPVFITTIGALLLLVIDLIKTPSKTFNTVFSVAVVLLSLLSLLGSNVNQVGFFGLVRIDGVSIIAQGIILLTSALFLPLSLTSQRFHEFEYTEFFALFLFLISSFQVMVSTDNLILMFIALEAASLALYTIIAMHNRDRSIEAAIKYFTMGSLAAGFFALGGALFYLATGSVELEKSFAALETLGSHNYEILLISLALLMGAIGFKLSIVPFHTWTPDVYEGASAPLAGYMSIVPKVAAFVIAIRLFEFLVASDLEWVKTMLWIAAVATMSVANILALVQESVKRMLAFSSISHAGFGIVAILVATNESNTALFMYWTLFMFANLGAFTMLWISRHKSKIFHNRFDHPYTKFSGMVYIAPIPAVIMGIFMLSLAGVPPFALFWGKFYLISATMSAGYIGLAIIMVLNSAVAVYYYIKLIIFMFLREPSYTDRTIYMHNTTLPFKFILALTAFLSVFSIFLINDLLTGFSALLKTSGF